MRKISKLIFLFSIILILSNYTDLINAVENPNKPVKKTYQKTVKGEYIVTVVKSSDESSLKKIFSKYEVIKIKKIRENTYLINIKSDPGIEKLKTENKKSKTILSIQPNYVYRSMK